MNRTLRGEYALDGVRQKPNRHRSQYSLILRRAKEAITSIQIVGAGHRSGTVQGVFVVFMYIHDISVSGIFLGRPMLAGGNEKTGRTIKKNTHTYY